MNETVVAQGRVVDRWAPGQVNAHRKKGIKADTEEPHRQGKKDEALKEERKGTHPKGD